MGSTIIPALRYDDAPAAIEFLCTAFGFERHAFHTGEHGIVEHAQLTLGDGMVMLGSRREGDHDQRVTTVAEAGRSIMTPYVVVEDVAAHAARAEAAGATIVSPVEAQDYGGSNYTCLDPEGNLWSFGSYDPWAPTD